MRAGHVFAYGGARVEVHGPSPDYEPGAEPRNDDSLVLRISWGRHSFLLTGDIERQGEAELIRWAPAAEVLKVAHHGSRSSTGAAFLDLVHPAFAVISAGFENAFNTPHPELLERLAARRIAVLRTDLSGLVSIRSDGRRLAIDTELWSGTRQRLPGF
jgi:competence protein ComEC